MRVCSKCSGELKHTGGFEKSAYERAGSALEVDKFTCVGCGGQYHHSYEERFGGDEELWSWRAKESDAWQPLSEKDWPTYRW